MDFNWDFSTPSSIFNPVQKGQFPVTVSSYFRRPSNKVAKSSSRNNSPRTSGQRRMTTTGHVPSRTRSVVDHQRTSAPQLSNTMHMGGSRPISWHPNMLDEISQMQVFNLHSNESLMTTPYTTAEVNGLVTPMSYPVMDEPQIQELITPLEGLSANEAGPGYEYSQDFDLTQYWLSQQAKDPVINFDPSLYSAVNYQPWYHADNQYMVPNIPTAPTSPSFLPMPEFGTPLDIPVPAPEDGSEELVAMGLYDSPADVQTSSLLFGGGLGAGHRKSLKLEDSFEPSPNDDEDDNNEEEDDDDDDAAVSGEEDDGQPGVSPTDVDYLPKLPQTDNTASIARYTPAMDNSYMTNQWQTTSQAGYGWI